MCVCVCVCVCLFASAKEAFLRVSDPMLIVSCEMKPDIEPDPYLQGGSEQAARSLRDR